MITRYGQWYIPQRDPRYLRRNALLVLGNIGVTESEKVQAIVSRYLESPDSMLRVMPLDGKTTWIDQSTNGYGKRWI
ncbi:MAG: hypothetical protein CM15mP49_00930 [Actinomycetota bacterium]|nr:MAG: hypothetical protein CM15mP49_00930 [Actinomycetota bacterium]